MKSRFVLFGKTGEIIECCQRTDLNGNGASAATTAVILYTTANGDEFQGCSWCWKFCAAWGYVSINSEYVE